MRNSYAFLAVIMSLASGSVSAQDADWTGAYGGLSMATNTGTHDYIGFDDYGVEGPAFGAFGGYLWGNGNLVYGAEVAATFGGVYEFETDGSESYMDEYEYDRFFDLKGRVGYAVSNFLVYGMLGVSRTRFDANIGEIDEVRTNATGLIYGLGADYKLGDSYFVGGEYLRRNYDYFEAGQEADIDANLNTFTLRFGMQF